MLALPPAPTRLMLPPCSHTEHRNVYNHNDFPLRVTGIFRLPFLRECVVCGDRMGGCGWELFSIWTPPDGPTISYDGVEFQTWKYEPSRPDLEVK